MNTLTPDFAADQLFLAARTTNKFQDRGVDDAVLRRLYDLYKWGPTAMNTQPARVVFVRSAQAKTRLASTLMEGNVEKTMLAPVTAIIARDSQFFEHLPAQFPAVPHAQQLFSSNAQLAQDTAVRNTTLQGAYLILAARLVGLGAGPMSGFDPQALDREFFPEGRFKSDFLINLGYPDPAGNYPRGPRLSFEDAARIV
ncbi:malonic semialdehyde reductase [Alcaligenes sp. A-TC2]|uniref:malonic semialdehyde reductase n=1 Tax=Alcaligenes TaxID=507 RepID=UPI00052D930B|nr:MULTISPECIES: malonic semialdehyde reductase [Alcaligenes]KGP01907.1 malonic semialdehyde reductase [Alcaligenes faecalis]MCX5471516.1 malonic semialdehyde reductase [Alcaligenes nematophilus]